MKKLLKIVPMSLMTICALASCSGTSTSASDSSSTSVDPNANWWAELNERYPDASASLDEEEARTIFNAEYFSEYNSPSYSSRVDSTIVYQPPSLFNSSHLDEGQYLVRQDSIYYYNNNVTRVTGSYYHLGYDGVTTREEMNNPPYPTGLQDEEEAVEYEYNEYLYVDEEANTMNCVYTRNSDVTDAYSFYKSGEFNWGSWESIYTDRENQGEMWNSLSTSVVTFYSQYRSSYAADGYTDSDYYYYGTKSTNSHGNVTLEIGFKGYITILPLYSAWASGWTNEDYRYVYIERFLDYDIRLYITDGNIERIYYNFNALMGQQYTDLNKYNVTPQMNSDGEYINYEVDEEWLANLDLVESQEETIYPNSYQYAFGYSDYGDFNKDRIVTTGYRESGPDDVGDNYYFDVSDLIQ